MSLDEVAASFSGLLISEDIEGIKKTVREAATEQEALHYGISYEQLCEKYFIEMAMKSVGDS